MLPCTIRVHGEEAVRTFNAVYEPASAPFAASVGSIEYFLTERYCLYHYDRRGRPYRLEIHHRPWSLQLARATITMNTMAAASHADAQRQPRAVALRTASRRGRMGADAFTRRPSSERAERHRVAQVGDWRDVMFIRSPRLVRHEIRGTPRERNLVGGRSTRGRRRWG